MGGKGLGGRRRIGVGGEIREAVPKSDALSIELRGLTVAYSGDFVG